jgi:hypothetical protein
MVYNTTLDPSHPPPHTHTLSYILNVYFGKGGGGVREVRDKVDRQQFTRGVENTKVTDCISFL